MKCPSCGAEDQTGKYCAECGSGLQVKCAACGAKVPPGSRFCPSCGEPVVGAGARGGIPRTAWIIGAAALVVVLLIVFLPRQTDRVTAPPAQQNRTPLGQAPAGAGGSGMTGLSPDMRTNADRLFTRIMIAAEAGNQAEVDQFMPMALQAYQMVDDLDDDGIYHLAILHQTAGNYDEARATAQRILDRDPNHILALGVAAGSAQAAGDTDTASALWQRLLDALPEETGKPLSEYMDHQAMFEEYRNAAREAIGD